MDTHNGGKNTAGKEAKNRKLFKDESEPSSTRWLRSDAKKRSLKTGDSTCMNSDKGEKKPKIDSSDQKIDQRLDCNDKETVVIAHGEKTIIDLPEKLLIKIIDLVPISQWASLELISHHLQDVVHKLWVQIREIRLDEFVFNKQKQPSQVADAVLEKFLIRSPNLASIIGLAMFCDRRASIRLPTILLLSKFKYLESIDFSGEKVITAKNFAVFFESSASRQCWKYVDLGGIFGSMKSQQENQPKLNLEYFKLNCAQLVCNFDRLFPIEWSRLKKLVIINCLESATDVLSIIRQCDQVTHLEIEVRKYGNVNGQPSYDNFMQAVFDLKNLSVLKLGGYSSWNNAFHNALLSRIQNLDHPDRFLELALVGICYGDQILGSIIDHLPHLKSLELDDVEISSSSFLLRLANEMVQLESLKLRFRWNFVVDGAIIRAIVGNMSNLQCLHLKNWDVKSEDLKSLGDLRKLKELRIMDKRIESGIIETWIHMGFGSCLESLELSFQDGISPETVVSFFKNMPRLSHLRSEGLTDVLLESIAVSCPNLIEFYVGWSSNTAVGIQSIIDRCSQLKILKLCDLSCLGQDKQWFPAALTVGKYRNITFKKIMWAPDME